MFSKDSRRHDGRGSWCKYCHNIYTKSKKYGITPIEIEILWAIEECEICGCHLEEGDACIDHNHTTGEVRGVLCHPCNRMLGFIEHSKYDRCLDYIDKYANKRNKWL